MKKIGIIGCGNMGEAILKGIISSKVASPRDLFISDVDSTKLNRMKNIYKVDATFNNSIVAKSCDIIIMAVKPQDLLGVLSSVSECLDDKKLIISIAAGITIQKIASAVGKKIPVIRVMPNMPVLIKRGFSALCVSKNCDANLIKFAKVIFGSVGEVAEVKEKDLDAITAISGSGPAYFFYLVELLIKNGLRLGLTSETAKRAAIQTALGSVELLSKINKDPALLRKRVTSKGGTTEAAFKVFKKRRLNDIFEKGLKAAKDRSKELSKG